MGVRFIIGVIAAFGSLALAFEAIGVEAPRPGAEGQSIGDSRAKDAVAYYNRAILYANKHQYELAIRDSTTAIQLNPKFAKAYNNRGAFHAEIGEFEKAIADFSQAIRFAPRSASAFYNRAIAFEETEKFDKAIADYDQLIRITPKMQTATWIEAMRTLPGVITGEPYLILKKAVQLSPNNATPWGYLANIRATCPDASLRNGKEAIRLSLKACELSKWKEPDHIQGLAAAYAETGDFDAAVRYQTQAMKLKSTYGPIPKEARERLAFYRNQKPWRAKPLLAR